MRLGPCSLQKLDMLFRMRLLNITLRNLLHHEVGINIDFLAQQAVFNPPFAGDGKDADGRLGVDKRIDTSWGIGELQCVCCL